jgi:hypothetical protein
VLSFSYKLRGIGWAYARLVDGPVEANMRVSYLSDALGDLTEATIRVLQGEVQTSFIWFDEPGEYQWNLRRVGETVDIRIGQRRFNDEAKNEVVLTFSCPVLHFAHQVFRELQRIYTVTGLVRYEQQWRGYKFPESGYSGLKTLIREYPLRERHQG